MAKVKTQTDVTFRRREAARVGLNCRLCQRMLPNLMRIASRSSIYSLLCCLLFAVAPEGVAQTYQGKQLVRPELLADTNAAVPGKPFRMGLLLRMAPG